VISTAEFYGGAADISTALTNYTHKSGRTKRVLRASWTTGTHRITLPTTLANTGSMPLVAGAPYQYIVNDGTVSVDVEYIGPGGDTTLGTLAANKVMIVFARITDTSGASPAGDYYAAIVDKAT